MQEEICNVNEKTLQTEKVKNCLRSGGKKERPNIGFSKKMWMVIITAISGNTFVAYTLLCSA